ncbi:hypothetical protein BCL57_003235 [Agromyces flavus]|uniref:Uncharacterized protein n=1 Tax=Agromyces flavus TaxID=589382 RepID=A0A1H1SNM1_9MICO|nr:hypothetical protein [Agromyces flavus]MCP2369056.1 hypothetical protein [Agromyces flavus]GGI48511.1 hypothetical protein GCM10010932_31990 [Agromyces flavus]SDS49594.1 hypothetical protein SAMN04489721_1414 [Agromyces flavus]
MTRTHTREVPRHSRTAVWTAVVALAAGVIGGASPAVAAEPAPLTNLAHLDFLMDTVSPDEVDGHTTYRLAEEPDLTMPWTYADARPGGTFERVGGGGLVDPVTGHWGQGAYNADDISRAAVVYLRHWQLTDDATSRQTAYELLRSLAYVQTVEGPNAGNVVLWMQPDGELNPSAEPVELPDPSDSGPSYWLARTLWAFGEGYAAFAAKGADPAFTAFLGERMSLARDAVDRQVLTNYGEFGTADGMRVPLWLIVDGADASAEAVLGLSAYVEAAPDDAAAADTLAKLAEGIALMSAGDVREWPYGAILPWAQSRSMWHAWGSQMPAALAEASDVLGDTSLLEPAVLDSSSFTPTLLTAGGPDNGWFPTPADRVQIAYGADSRVQSLLSVADASGSTGFAELAAIQAAWFFGANRADEAMYDPATGVTYDGIQPDGTINRNSGAESTIHGLLTMLALDARPELAERATSVDHVASRHGLTTVEAEDAVSTTGIVVAPESAWTGESLYSGSTLVLDRRDTATFDLGVDEVDRWVEPVAWIPEDGTARSIWQSDGTGLGSLDGRGEPQGISPVPGVLLPRVLQGVVDASESTVTARVVKDAVTLDALIVRPVVSRLLLEGEGGATELVHSSARSPQRVPIGFEDRLSTANLYDSEGRLVSAADLDGAGTIRIPSGGFAVVSTDEAG